MCVERKMLEINFPISYRIARNAEKAMTTLSRWRAAQLAESGKTKERRPYLASECSDLHKAEQFRMQIVREIAKKVAQIQNAGLGEYRIRDLNDEINKLLREKGHWQKRIRELGGPNYPRYGPKVIDHDGREVPGNRGYKYFGAAKDLPGVRELFEREPLQTPRKTRAEIMKDIDADYYGYRDDDDGIIVPLEIEEEKKAIAKAIEEWKEAKATSDGNITDTQKDEEENIYAVDPDADSDDEQESDPDDHEPKFIAHVPVPSQKEVEEALLRRKKQELLEKYASETLVQQSNEAKALLGMH